LPQSPITENPISDNPLKVDLAIIARDLKLSPENVEKTIQLLDDGNTIPFITRFRKDLTGGLNEKQISAIKQQVAQLRALSERKNFIIKSIESQGKLTDELKASIHRSHSSRRLEDLYLPFKPKKQTKAATAKQQGLEPLAEDIFTATSPDVDLATRATEFVRVDKGLKSVDDVIRGVGDLLVERFSENGELRSSLRQVLWNTGKLVTQSTEPPTVEKDVAKNQDKNEAKEEAKGSQVETTSAKLAKQKSSPVQQSHRQQRPPLKELHRLSPRPTLQTQLRLQQPRRLLRQ
jgi:uncharacterized protein